MCFTNQYGQVHDRPWWHPEHVHAGDVRGIPAGFYRATSATLVEERCVLDPPAEAPTAEITRIATRSTVTTHQETPADPLPWAPIGIAGLLVLGLLGAIVMRLRAGQPTSRAVRPVRWTDTERDIALHGATVLLLWALILIEIECWAAGASMPLAGLIAVAPALWLLVMLPPRLRTFTVTVRALVDHPPTELFALIGDPRNHHLWDKQMGKVEPQADGLPRAGLRYRECQRLADGRAAEFESVITEYEPDRRFSTQLDGTWHPQRFTWTFETRPDGKTVVTSVVRLEVGPLFAMSTFLFNRSRFVYQITSGRRASLTRLLGYLTGNRDDPVQAAAGPGADLDTIHAWMRGRPDLFKFGPGLSAGSFALTTGVYVLLTRLWPGPWFGLGFAGLLLIHEMGHYLYGRHARLAPGLPIFVIVGAFVPFNQPPADGLTRARAFGAGAFVASVAVAALLVLYGATGFWPVLALVVAGSAFNLQGSLLPYGGTDAIPMIAAFAGWLPLFGVVFGLALFAGAAALGYVSPLLVAIGFLAVLAVSQRFRMGHLAQYWRLSTGARLVLGTTALTMVLYLGAVLFLSVNWL